MRLFSFGILLVAFQTTSVFAETIFPNSVVSNNLEFIKTSDQSVFSCVAYDGKRRAEMPDKRSDNLMANGTFVFSAQYKDGTAVELWAHPDFGSQSSANASVTPVAEAIGKLPTLMRSRLDHVVIHKGDETAFGEADGRFFVLYSDNIRTRIRNHDLEETVFHESVHATLDSRYSRSRAWRNAVKADGAYVTEYAANQPRKEDMAESALFAWAMLLHPGRLPRRVEAQVKDIMPNRLAFFSDVFLSQPMFRSVGSVRGC